MSEKMEGELFSRRRACSLLGLAAGLTATIPAVLITATSAEARVGNPGSAVSIAGANRRNRRQDRRYKKSKDNTPASTEEKK